MQDAWAITEEYKNLCKERLRDNLAPLRAKLNISQEKLANIIGVSRQTYYGIETGNRKMSWTAYLALTFFFDSIQETSIMLKELRVYPHELVERINVAVGSMSRK